MNFRCVQIVLNTVATEASSCFVLMNRIFDEAQMYAITNVHLIWVNTRKALIEFLNICLHCFKFHIKLIKFSIWLKDQQMHFQDCNCWCVETIYRKCFAKVIFSNSNFKVFFGLFLNSPLILYITTHQLIEGSWRSWCGRDIQGMKVKKTFTSRNHEPRTIKMPVSFKTLLFDIRR